MVCSQQTLFGSLAIINLTSSQITVTVQTINNSSTQNVLPIVNPELYDMNFYQNHTFQEGPTPTLLTYDSTSPVIKLTITRISTTMPQVVYYTGNQNLAVPSNMIVQLNSIEINNDTYQLNDLNSYVAECNQLQSLLTSTNIDATEQALNDVKANVKLVEDSDKASLVATQTTAVEAAINDVLSAIKTMTNLNKNLQTVQDLQNNLPSGLNIVEDGKNNPENTRYSVQQTAQQIQDILQGVQMILQKNTSGPLYELGMVVQNAINKLQLDLQQLQTNQAAMNFEILISPNSITV